MTIFNALEFPSPKLWGADRGQVLRDMLGVQIDLLRPDGEAKPTSMTEAEWNAAKIGTLMPAYRGRFEGLLDELDDLGNERGVDFMTWDATRSLERQVDLYGRGRLDKGDKVTFTIASNHLWALAIDTCQRSPSGQPIFKLPSWWEKDALLLAAKHGLESLFLATGKDPPHIQVPAAEQPSNILEIKRALIKDFKRQPFYTDYGG